MFVVTYAYDKRFVFEVLCVVSKRKIFPLLKNPEIGETCTYR